MTDKRLSPEDFDRLAAALFGVKYSRPMADAMGVHLQTVYNWKRDGAPIDTLCPALARWIIQQESALDMAREIVLKNR